MARKLTTNQDIDAFLAKVIGEAHHHGGNVEHVIQLLSDAVKKRLNPNLDKVEVYERNGNLARTCWVTLRGSRYVFSYDYRSQKIKLLDHSTQGRQRYAFDNSTSLADIQREVALL